jgi:hypothetical protein
MTRHIIDRETLRDTGLRLREFLRIDRESGLHPAVVRLHAMQHHAEDDGARLAHYLRIERGRTA